MLTYMNPLSFFSVQPTVDWVSVRDCSYDDWRERGREGDRGGEREIEGERERGEGGGGGGRGRERARERERESVHLH